MKNGLSLVLFVVLTLTAVNSFAQQEFTFTTTKANLVASKATIEMPGLANNPQAIIVATPIGDTVTVKGILEKGQIHHSIDRPFNSIEETLTFDSGWVKADVPLPPDFERWKGKLEVKVYNRLSKLPGN